MTRNQIVFLACLAILVLAALTVFAAFYVNRPVSFAPSESDLTRAANAQATAAMIHATTTAIQQVIDATETAKARK